MNRYYVLFPIVLLCVFGVVYWQHSKEAEQEARVKAEIDMKKHEEEQAKKRLAEQRSKEDADKRTAERAKADADKKAEKQAKYEADIQKIKDETAKYAGEANGFAKQVAAYDTELANLRAAKEKANREAFDLDKKVELSKVDKRNAELEIQRYTEMIAKKASDSAIAKPPVVSAVTASK